MNPNFSGKTAVYVSYSYSKEHSCKKAKKSLERFSRFLSDTRTDGRTDGPTLPGLTSTEVENCKGPCEGPAQLQKPFPRQALFINSLKVLLIIIL